MEFPALTREQSRQIDARAIDEYGFSGRVLMENAGRGCVDVLERLGIAGPVVVLCGKGNNAGDGFVIARHLEIRGHDCRVVLLCSTGELRGDAAKNHSILARTDVKFINSLAELNTIQADWIVDAMLGTGAVGEPRPPFDAAINWMNSQGCKKLAVDVPSGLDCDSGEAAVHTVRADHTCTFATTKVGYMLPTAKPFTGIVHVCDIGVPPRLIREISKA